MPVWGPTKWYYALALAGIAVSVFALYFFVERRSAAIADDLTRVIVPAESSVTLAASGHHTIFVEHQSVVDDQLFLTAPELGDLQCTLTGPDGDAIDLAPALWGLRYEGGGRAGVAVLGFRAAKPGRYRLSAEYPDGKVGTTMVLAVGHGLLGDLSSSILGGLALALVPGVAGLGVGVVTWWARYRARSRIYGRFTPRVR